MKHMLGLGFFLGLEFFLLSAALIFSALGKPEYSGDALQMFSVILGALIAYAFMDEKEGKACKD